MFGFKPETFDQKWGLFGQILVINPQETPKTSDHVVVNFSVDKIRYYTMCEFRRLGPNGVLRMVGPLFRLERRNHLRIPLTEDFDRGCNVIKKNSVSTFMDGQLIDVSQSGVQLRIKDNPLAVKVQPGDNLEFVMHLDTRSRIPAQGVVRHCKMSNHGQVCGIEFTTLTERVRRKLISMTLDLQRKILISQQKN